ncbi:MAG: Gx transporter family protein [Clostridia bacterium]|nr:Gx transporter family protein [Clostridia bacterium]
MSKTKKIALVGVAAAAAMVLSYVESLVPLPIYGVKIGLANIVTVFLMYKLNSVTALGVSMVRVLLTALLFGSVMSLWYSLAGALFSFGVMALMKKIDAFSTVGVSIAGGVAHNMAQIAVAVLITGVGAIVYYLPTLIVGGIAAGIVVGIAGSITVKRVKIK